MSTGMPSGYSSLGGQVLNPYDIDAEPERLELRLRRRGGRRPRRDHDRHRDLRLDRQPVGGAGRSSGLRPTVGLVSRDRHPADLLHAGHGRADDAHRRRRRRRAAGHRRPRSRGPRTAARADLARLPQRPEDRRAGRQADRRHQQHQCAVRQAAIAAVQALGATTVQIAAPTSAAPFDVLTRRVQARPERVPRPPARERADEVARGHHRLQHRARRRGARSSARRSSPRARPSTSATRRERRLRRRP